MSAKRVLVIGATGAMGQYVVPELAALGYEVDAVALDLGKSELPNVHYFQGNAWDKDAFKAMVEKRYDGIVNFMSYSSPTLDYYLPLALDNCGHYIFLSSYRVFDNKELPLKEDSPRLIDTGDDMILRNAEDYCIYKARGENFLKYLPHNNYTIIRPAVTYGLLRYHLVTLGNDDTVGRARMGKKTVLPEEARNVPGTMTWGGDVAKMISKLLFNESALGETYNTTTSEHHTWGEIADYYKDICNLNVEWVSKDDYLLAVYGEQPYNLRRRWQLDYDRLFPRIMDNSKILAATGMKQEALMPLYEGLKREISRCPADHEWVNNDIMDKFLSDKGLM